MTRPSSGWRAAIYTDGAGNKGTSCGIGAIVMDWDTKAVVSQSSMCIGLATNNVAEYIAVIRGLEQARDLGYTHVKVFADSEIVVNQVLYRYDCKLPHLRACLAAVKELQHQFAWFDIVHVDRELNEDADALAKAGKTAVDYYRSDVLQRAHDELARNAARDGK